ncbi:unnamed protein product [Urochloa decumbens]|uniref:RRM domain-containing protein n=1 Tax=Urochloa decumbens TaxID=240449 RepID=A0ABC9FWI1_9POAL
MAAAATQCSRLNASAPPFVLGMPLVPPPVTSELYTGPPPSALPPAGFYYPPPVLVAPPAPCFQPGAFLSWSAFPQGPCVGMPTSGWAPVTPMATLGMPASPAAAAPFAPEPQLPGIMATPQGRRRHGRQHFAARRLPRLELPPRMQRAAGRAAAAHSSSPAGAKGEPVAKEASPRSVLVQMRASPPDTPPALPTSFPYPELGSPSPPASEVAPSSISVPAGGCQAVAAAPRRRRGERAPPLMRRSRRAAAGAGGTARPSDPKPRRIFDQSSNNTSLMIRNLPNDFRRTRLMQIIDQHCSIENEKISSGGGIKSEYDFLYLPMDFRTGANKGYAFVNLTTPEAARRLHDHLHGLRWKVNGSGKTCEVDLADVEGLDDLVKNLSQSRFDCGDEEFLPVWFEPPRDGSRRTLPHLVGRMLRCW